MLCRFCSKFNSVAFQQCKNFENLLRFDTVTDSLKVGIFFETQCSSALQPQYGKIDEWADNLRL